MHNEGLLGCTSRHISERWAGQVARIVEKLMAYRVLLGKPERRRLHRWERTVDHLNTKVFFYPMLPDFRNSIVFKRFPVLARLSFW